MVKEKIVESHRVPEDGKGARLSEYARDLFASLPSRKSVKKAIKSGRLQVDGKPATTAHRVEGGQVLTVGESTRVQPEYELDLEILYEDGEIAVVYKPADIEVGGVRKRTLAHALPRNLSTATARDALKYPRPVHRLDRMTGGPVIVAKTLSAAATLGTQFERREVAKTYIAVVHGSMTTPHRLADPVDGKEAMSLVYPLTVGESATWGPWSTVAVKPATGRRHQIRVHLAASGHPIAGDVDYGGRPVGRGLMLCGYRVRFRHPDGSGEVDVRAEPAKKFRHFLRGAEDWEHV